MRVLEFGAVNLHDGVYIGKEHFGGRLNYARLAGTGRAKEQHRPDWAIRWIHAGQKNLVEAAHAPDGTLLTNNACSQAFFEILGTRALCSGSRKTVSSICTSGASIAFLSSAITVLFPGSNDSFRADWILRKEHMQRAIRCERLMRGGASEFLTKASRARPRSRSTHTLYIRL